MKKIECLKIIALLFLTVPIFAETKLNKPYHHTDEGAFRNPKGSPKLSPDKIFSFFTSITFPSGLKKLLAFLSGGQIIIGPFFMDTLRLLDQVR